MYYKKIFLIIFFSFIWFSLLVFNLKKIEATTSSNESLNIQAKSCILIEAETGRILYSQDENRRLFPASMTKIVTMLLTMEAIESDRIRLYQMHRTSAYAKSMGGSTIYLDENEKMNTNDLLKGVAIASGNDAAVVLAESISGDVGKFVEKMNEKSDFLQLKNTHFSNPTGLPSKNHYSSCYDMAMFSRELVLKYPKILEYTSIYEDYLRKGEKNEFWLVNTNKLVRTYKGIDGLKTGWTEEAGYCLSATIMKDNMRLIGVIMGASTSDLRNKEMVRLLEYGFANYKINILHEKGEVLKVKYNLGIENNKIEYSINKNIVICSKKEEKYDFKEEISLFEKSDKIGEYSLYINGVLNQKVDIEYKKKPKKNHFKKIILSLYRYYLTQEIK